MQPKIPLNQDLKKRLFPSGKRSAWEGVLQRIFFWSGLLALCLLLGLLLYRNGGIGFMEGFPKTPSSLKSKTTSALIFDLPPLTTALKATHPSGKEKTVHLHLSLELNLPQERPLIKLVEPKILRHLGAYLREVHQENLAPPQGDFSLMEEELRTCVDSVIKPLKIKGIHVKSLLLK